MNKLTIRVERSPDRPRGLRLVILESPEAPHPLNVVESNLVLGESLTRLYLGACCKHLLSKCDPIQLDRALLGLK